MTRRRSAFATTFCFGILAAGMAAPQETKPAAAPAPAAAVDQQPTTPSAADTPAARAAEEEILVTGSRVRRKDLTTPAPVTILTRQQLQDSGFAWRVVGGVEGYAANMVVAQTPAAGTTLLDTGAPLVKVTLARNGRYRPSGVPQNTSPYGPTAARQAR